MKQENHKYTRCSICDYCKEAPTTDQFLYGSTKNIYFIKDHKTGESICNLCHKEIRDTVYDDLVVHQELEEYADLLLEGGYEFTNEYTIKALSKEKEKFKESTGRKTHPNPNGRAGLSRKKKGWNPGDPLPDDKYKLDMIEKQEEVRQDEAHEQRKTLEDTSTVS